MLKTCTVHFCFGFQKVTAYALIPTILTVICFFFPYGYSLGTINSAAIVLKEFFNDSHVVLNSVI